MNIETQADTRTVLGLIPGAENLIHTSDNRWFVSGGDGLYQIDPNGVDEPRKIPFAFDTDSPPSTDNQAAFLGITQHENFLYASCTPSMGDPRSPRYIMFMDLTQSVPALTAIHKTKNLGIFNGMASDKAGNLYVSDFGMVIPPTSGKIVKLSLSSPTTVSAQSNWLETPGGHPNGIKIDGDMLYFSEEALFFIVGQNHIRKVGIKPDGTADAATTIFSSGNGQLLDDIELVDDGLVITKTHVKETDNTKVNKVIHISEHGEILHMSQTALALPSAVKLVPDGDSTAASLDLIVTERGGTVSRLSQNWGLKQRH